MNQDAAKHLRILIAMIDRLPVRPTPEEVGKLQGQATLFRIWHEPELEDVCSTRK